MDRDYNEYRFYVEPIGDNLDEVMPMWKAHWDEQREEDLRGVVFCPAIDYFKQLEKSGHFVHITVRKDKELVGHFGLAFGMNKNTSQRVAGDDFFFIKPEHRKGLLGVKLIKFARDYSFEIGGATEFSVSYRVSVADLDPILRRCGMHKIASVYTVRR